MWLSIHSLSANRKQRTERNSRTDRRKKEMLSPHAIRERIAAAMRLPKSTDPKKTHTTDNRKVFLFLTSGNKNYYWLPYEYVWSYSNEIRVYCASNSFICAKDSDKVISSMRLNSFYVWINSCRFLATTRG